MILLHIWCRIIRLLLFLTEMFIINFIPKCQNYIINYGCLCTVLFSDQLTKDILIFFFFLYYTLNLYLNSWFDFLLYDISEYLLQVYWKVVILITKVLFFVVVFMVGFYFTLFCFVYLSLSFLLLWRCSNWIKITRCHLLFYFSLNIVYMSLYLPLVLKVRN